MAAPGGKRAPKKTGPAGLTPAKRKKYLDAIRLGLNKDDAALLVGVAHGTYFNWIKRGRENDAPEEYARFVLETDLALIQFEEKMLGLVHKGAEEEWQAAMTALERKFPDKYGRRTRVESNVTITAQPMWDTSLLTLEEKQELARLIRKCSPAPEQLEQGQAPVLELLRGGEFVDGEVVAEE